MADRQRNFTNANQRAKRLRREPTSAEARLWQLLRKLEGTHFRRQPAVGPYVFDFGDLGLKTLREVDGGVHDLAEVRARDAAKDQWALSQGFVVLRMLNQFVFGTAEPAIAIVMAELSRQARATEGRKR